MNRRIPLLVFKKSNLQVDLIELDVHLSADGELMVIHDETIDRTTNEKERKPFSVLELKQFKMERQRIPTLSEVLNLINQKCKVNIELKSYETADS
jgi:glycerophosphoryl diester phosphodiesterase